MISLRSDQGSFRLRKSLNRDGFLGKYQLNVQQSHVEGIGVLVSKARVHTERESTYSVSET